jgi:hypothetical protein
MKKILFAEKRFVFRKSILEILGGKEPTATRKAKKQEKRPLLKDYPKLPTNKEKKANRVLNKKILTLAKARKSFIEREFKRTSLSKLVRKRAVAKLKKMYGPLYSTYQRKNEKVIAKATKSIKRSRLKFEDVGDVKLSAMGEFSKIIQKLAGYRIPAESTSEFSSRGAGRIGGLDKRSIQQHMNLISKLNGKAKGNKLMKISQNAGKIMKEAIGSAVYHSYTRGSINLFDKEVDKQIEKFTKNA